MERAVGYLSIPGSYAAGLEGLRWSERWEAVEDRHGRTLALVPELSHLLEGLFHDPPTPPFAFALTLLCRMKRDARPAHPTWARLRQAYAAAPKGSGLARNAGLLFGALCRGLPGLTLSPSWTDIRGLLSGPWVLGELPRPTPGTEPALPRLELERLILARLKSLDDDDLLHWLRHGTGKSPAGKALAATVESLPARVLKVLALARRAPRLVGAASLTPAVESALTLPPRRRVPDALPQGGYADVTTRGHPDRLLLSQFALESDEFVRRFAEHELLYFKREEPHAARKPERLIVLDQGVRTWGAVRLGLAAAALVLLKQDARRHGVPRLVLTSAMEPIDLDAVEPGELVDMLSMSDLTPHPADSLALGLGLEVDGPRDVILLTHPRNLAEPQLVTAAARRGPADRLFSLAVDAGGMAELGEWTDRGPVPIRSFRVDLVAAEAARVESEGPRGPAVTVGPWTGAVEPIPFPFRSGIVADPLVFGFQADGPWVVVGGRGGILHGLALDGTPAEVLPRPFRSGRVLKNVEAILGVNGGVVVCGRMSLPVGTPTAASVLNKLPVMTSSASPGPSIDRVIDYHVAAHYNRLTYTVRLHVLGPSFANARWSAYPELHCVTAAAPPGSNGKTVALDLDTEGRVTRDGESGQIARAVHAFTLAARGGSAPYRPPIQRLSGTPAAQATTTPTVQLIREAIRVIGVEPNWGPFVPLRDGRPLLAGVAVDRAQLAGDVLALSLFGGGKRTLVLFRGPDGAVLNEEVSGNQVEPFQLSADGRLLARRRKGEVIVRETAGLSMHRAAAPLAHLHSGMDLQLEDPFRLTVGVGSWAHVFWVQGGELRHHSQVRNGKPRVPAGRQLWTPVAYDSTRFPPQLRVETGGWTAVPDRLGQVALFTIRGTLVASFIVRRNAVAAWAPGGVFWGDAALIGGAPTPDAATRIGRTIQAAAGG